MPLSMIVGIEPATLTEVLFDRPILRSANESPTKSLLARPESINSQSKQKARAGAANAQRSDSASEMASTSAHVC